jgi:hypothetical protein
LPEPPIVWISSSRHALVQQYGEVTLASEAVPSGKCRGPREGNINLATVAKVEWRYVSEVYWTASRLDVTTRCRCRSTF